MFYYMILLAYIALLPYLFLYDKQAREYGARGQSEKDKGTDVLVKKCLIWKKKQKQPSFLNWVKNFRNNFQVGVFDLHFPFWIIQVLYCQTKICFYWSEDPFSKNNFIKFFILNKQFPDFFMFFFGNIFITYFGHLFDLVENITC